MTIRGEYSSCYNFRPGESYGMGKESIRHQCTYDTLEEFFENIATNSRLTHNDAVQWESWMDGPGKVNDKWVKWIGQPSHYIFDIKWEAS